MKLYIPQLGDRLRLIADWTFDLYNDSRNSSLMHLNNDMRPLDWYLALTAEPVTIPAGAVLKIDRIYIRKGNEDYSSVSFFWEGMKVPPGMYPGRYSRQGDLEKYPGRPVRFWAKLDDVNKIEFDQV